MQKDTCSKPTLNVVDEGVAPYRAIWDKQKNLQSAIIEAKRNKKPIDKEYLLLVEHLPVYTLGHHGNEHNMLFNPADTGIECIRIERGGDITFHGPGQLVAYPIIDLEAHSFGVKKYVTFLEQVVIDFLALYGVKGERVDGATGVWIGVGTPQERKICAIGVKCSRFVTMHGLALNINTDLSYFSKINPCGFIDKGVTSLSKEINRDVDMTEVKLRFTEIFKNLLP
jgi:lipoyl(octanoyl) transferase